jgi:hypothetical protein
MMLHGRCLNTVFAYARTLAVAVAIVGVFEAQPASATTVSYTGESVIGDTIHISSPRSVTGIAGQVTLTGVTGLGPSITSIVTWCLDIVDNLQGHGTFTGLGPLANASNLIGGLMMEGNNYIAQAQAHGNSLSIGGHTYTTNDISAAAQVAIWSAEDGASFIYSSISTTASSANFNALVSYLDQHATPNVAYWTLNQSGNQTQGTLVPVPGPIVGSGVPSLIFVTVGLLAWSRRKTRERKTYSALA